MENIINNNFTDSSLELDNFYSKSFLVNGDANFENLMPSTNDQNITGDDKQSLGSKLENNNKLFESTVKDLQGTYNDPFYNNRMYGFNPSFKGLNMDRYDDAELGFDPFRDNEKFYNDNTSMVYDYARAFGGFWKLTGSAFVDTASSLGRMFQGDFDISKEAALDSERIMAETMSTKGGILPGVANFMVNTGFTAGVLLELAAEELLIATISGLTSVPSGGASLGAGGILAATRAGMAGTKLVSMYKNMGNLAKALRSLDNVNDARQYFTAFGKGTLNFLNPLQNTTSLFVGGNQLKGLNQMAAASKGFGAFFTDIRDINRSFSEARLEGGFVYNKMFEDLVNEHYNKTGVEPTGAELNSIKSISHEAAVKDMLINLPVIHYTNNIVFGNLAKPFGKLLRGTDDTLKILGSKIGLVDDVWQELEKSYKASLRRNLNPRNIAKNSLTYFSKNLAEGLQESFQEATAIATEDYYKNLYFSEKNPSRKQIELSWLDSYGLGISEQFSAQGAEVFASGFFMGGVTHNVVKSIRKTANYLHENITEANKARKAKSDPEYAKIFEQEKLNKKAKEENNTRLKAELIESLNTLYQDPGKLFTPDLENMTAQEILAEKIRLSKVNGDNKFLIDFTDESFFKHIKYALGSGKYDSFLERLEGRLNLNNDELSQATGIDGETARARLEVAVERAKEIKRRIDLAPKNPIDLSRYKKGTPEYINAQLLSTAFEHSKESMVFTAYSFDRKLERMRSITNDFANINILGNATAIPFTHLFGYNSIIKEQALLESEITQLEGGTEENKKEASNKKRLYSKLETFRKRIIEFQEYSQEVKENSKIEDIAEMDPLYGDRIKIAFKNYLSEYADINGTVVKSQELDKAFELLFDYYRLNEDVDDLSDAVAIISTPEFLTQEANRRSAILTQIYNNRKEYIKKSVDGFYKIVHLNNVFEKLQKIGVAIDPDEAIEFNTDPKKFKIRNFINAKDLSIISENDPKMKEIKEIIDDYEISTGIRAEEEEEAKLKAEEEEKKRKEEEEKKEREEEEARAKAKTDKTEGFDKKTIKELEDAYENYPKKDDESFEEFLDSPQAKRIIAKATRGKEPEEAPSSTLGFENLGDIGNQGLAIMEDDILKKGKSIIPGISKATPEQKQKIDDNIEELKKKYPEKNIISKVVGNDLIIESGTITPTTETQVSPYGVIAADYLFTGGPGVILSTDYFIQALSGAFINAGAKIEQIRQKYINEGIDLGFLKDALGTENYNKIIAEIKDAINSIYNNQEAIDIFNIILNNASGFPTRLGNEISAKLEKLNAELATPTTTASDKIEGQVGTSNYSVDSGLIFYNNPDGTVTPVANPKGEPVMDVIIDDIEKRKQEAIASIKLDTRKVMGEEQSYYVSSEPSEFKGTNIGGFTKQEAIDKIDAKYNAELKALKAKPTSTASDVEDKKAKIEKDLEVKLTNEELEVIDYLSGKKSQIKDFYDNRNLLTELGRKLNPIVEQTGKKLAEAISKKLGFKLEDVRVANNLGGFDVIKQYQTKDGKPIGDYEQLVYNYLNSKYDAELAALKGEQKTSEEQIVIDENLTEEENYLLDVESNPDAPFEELKALYEGPKFMLTEDETLYYNPDNPKQKALRVSELKPEYKGDAAKVKFYQDRGNIIDFLLRQFIAGKINAENINVAANAYIKYQTARNKFNKKTKFSPDFFNSLYKDFEKIKEEFDSKGYTPISDLPTLYGTLGDTLYAGTVDLIVKDKDGNYFIIDLKTSSSNRREDYNNELKLLPNYGYMTSDAIQQNAYKELLKQRTGIEVKGLMILPIQVESNVQRRNALFINTSLSKVKDSYLMKVDDSKSIYELVPDKIRTSKKEKSFPIADSFVGKIIYMSPGTGKTDLVKNYPDVFVDMDQLIADELSKIIDGVNSENIAQKMWEYINDLNNSTESFNTINTIYSKAYDKAREFTAQGKTVLTGSRRYISGSTDNKYADIAVKIKSDKDIIKQIESKNTTATKEEIKDQLDKIRKAEKNADILVTVTKKDFVNLLEGNFDFAPFITIANSNRQIMILDNMIPSNVSAENIKMLSEKKELMSKRMKMYKNLEPGDVVELLSKDGTKLFNVIVDEIIDVNGKSQPKFEKNKNNISSLVSSESYRIVNVTKNGKPMETPDISEKADADGKNNLSNINTDVVNKVKDLISENNMKNYNRNSLFDNSEDPTNCNS